jgi:RND family efflux transporter MFP subunit
MSADVDIKQLAIVRDEGPPEIRRGSRHVVSRYVIPGALLASMLALCVWAGRDVIWPPQNVSVVPVFASQSAVQSEGTPLFQAAGWIEPRPTPIRVAALAAGVVERLLVVEDLAVKAGEPIAELVKRDAELAKHHAEADLKIREAELAEAQANLQAATTRLEQPVHLQAALSEADAALAQIATELKNLPFETRRAEAQLEFATANYEGKRSSEGTIATRTIQQAKSEQVAAEALVAELQGRADSLKQQQTALTQRRDALATQLKLLASEKQAVAEANAKLAVAAAQADHARIGLDEAKLRLDRMTIRAPVDGRVYQLVANPGTTLTGGMSPVANADGSTVVTMYRPDMLQVRVDVRFEDLPKVTLGQKVTINNPALAEPISGTVLFISSKANIQKNTLEVKVALDKPVPVFRPEMLVNVTHLASKPTEAVAEAGAPTRLYIPQQLVLRDEAGSYVWVADQSAGLARKTAVTTGTVAPGGLVEVTNGLTVASRIIADNHELLRDRARIHITREETPRVASAADHAPATERQTLNRLPHGE